MIKLYLKRFLSLSKPSDKVAETVFSPPAAFAEEGEDAALAPPTKKRCQVLKFEKQYNLSNFKT